MTDFGLSDPSESDLLAALRWHGILEPTMTDIPHSMEDQMAEVQHELVQALARIKGLQVDLQVREFDIKDLRTALEAFREFDGNADLWATLKEQRDTATTKIATLTAQRDRLLGAAREAKDWLEYDTPTATAHKALNALAAAIREVEAAKAKEPSQ